MWGKVRFESYVLSRKRILGLKTIAPTSPNHFHKSQRRHDLFRILDNL